MAEHLNLADIKKRLRNNNVGDQSFPILKALCAYAANPSTSSQAADLILRALERRDEFGAAIPILDGLVRQRGLFPYLDPKRLGFADMIAYECHRPEHMDDYGVVFHAVQAQAYELLRDRQNVILSAPTSFGKSLIIDAIIASRLYANIAVIVPTLALADETRRRLSRFRDRFKLITHASQRRAERNLFIMTQERILEREDLEPMDFFVIDEFYKLQPRAEDIDRSLLLNEAFYRLHKTGAQFYLLGPNIEGLSGFLPDHLEFRFLKTDYKTVVSEVHSVKRNPTAADALVRLCSDLTDSTLIYCNSPASVRRTTKALIDGGISVAQPAIVQAVDWIEKEYSSEWLFAKALRAGIGIHHGKLPRSLAQHVVRAFNDGSLKFLICTSTLIEGVNTKARNVVVYDNKIARKKFDYFTYNNIIGRSGRMFHHFVGHVYIFHDPPGVQLPLIDVPAFTQPEDTPASLLVQLDNGDLTPASRTRIDAIAEQDVLTVEVMRKNHGIDPHFQIDLARELLGNATHYWPLLCWHGQPEYEQLKTVCELIWEFLLKDGRRRAGVSSGSQLAYKINHFRQTGSASALLKAELSTVQEPADDVVENTIEFLRSWANFEFPRLLMTLDRIQADVFNRLGRKPGNYAYYAGQVENWFVGPAIMALDEYGIPVQVGQKLHSILDLNGDLDETLTRLRTLDPTSIPLHPFEKELIRDAKLYL